MMKNCPRPSSVFWLFLSEIIKIYKLFKQQKDSVHCSQNRIPIKGLLHCWKCSQESKGKIRGFHCCRQLYYHYTKVHSGFDKDCFPNRDLCIFMLQVISDSIIFGVLK